MGSDAGLRYGRGVLATGAGEGRGGAAYEAGPTGFGLARALEAAGIACVVAAPSKLERAPPGIALRWADSECSRQLGVR